MFCACRSRAQIRVDFRTEPVGVSILSTSTGAARRSSTLTPSWVSNVWAAATRRGSAVIAVVEGDADVLGAHSGGCGA